MPKKQIPPGDLHRTQEISVSIALGARRADVTKSVVPI